MEYKPYKGKALCQKCGSIIITTNYDRQTDLLLRSCTRCSYSWKETPIYNEKKKKEASNK